MICVTIQGLSSAEAISDLLEKSRPQIMMAEIRLDRCPLSLEDIEALFSSSDTPLIATARVAGDGSGTWEEAEKKLSAAIQSGAAFADLEIEAPKEMGKRLRRLCNEYGTVMIRSAHFFDGTPSMEKLIETESVCRKFGGEIAKIAAMAHSPEDVRRVMDLYEYSDSRLVAFAMGQEGRESRLECLKLGSPFTYAALSEAEAAAPGQWDYASMMKAVYGSRKMLGMPDCADNDGVTKAADPTYNVASSEKSNVDEDKTDARNFVFNEGETADSQGPVLRMPASKSFAQRAIVAAALADGRSELGGWSSCGDNEAALGLIRSLGAKAEVIGDKVIIEGLGSKSPTDANLFVGESGLLTRLTIPIVAALNGNAQTRIDGCGTLPSRPLKGAAEIMAAFGTVLRSEAPGIEVHVPLSVQGPLLAADCSVSGKGGSQLISGLLMALPLLQEDSTVHVHDPKSIPYMFITCDVLRRFGIRISSEMEGGEDFMETGDFSRCTGITFRISGRQAYSPASFDIEGDWSAAANFLVAGALFGRARLTGLDTSSLQADISIMDILMDAGASLSHLEDEDGGTGIVTCQRSPLRPFDTDLNNCPDLFPIVSVLAAFCPGRTNIQGFKRLASKESDRGKAILNMLAQMGVPASAEGDTLTIDGESVESRLLNGHLLRGGEYTSSRDHRMAMALTVAEWCADSPIEIDDIECTAKSFPAFMETYKKLIHRKRREESKL